VSASPLKVLVTGARGQLARAIMESYGGDADIRAYSRSELDISDFDAVMDRVEPDPPDVIINCAAYTNVDLAEDEVDKALNSNAFAVRVLARVAQTAGATLVHYSTDFVFDGHASRPYVEEDPANPQSVYAQSKLLGEWFALEAPRAFVLRVESLFGGPNAKSSIDRIAQAVIGGREAKVFRDRIVSPSYVVDVASATWALLERGEPVCTTASVRDTPDGTRSDSRSRAFWGRNARRVCSRCRSPTSRFEHRARNTPRSPTTS